MFDVCLHPYTYQPTVYIVYIAKLTISVLHHVYFVYIAILINFVSTLSTSPTLRSGQYRYYVVLNSSTSLYLSVVCLRPPISQVLLIGTTIISTSSTFYTHRQHYKENIGTVLRRLYIGPICPTSNSRL